MQELQHITLFPTTPTKHYVIQHAESYAEYTALEKCYLTPCLGLNKKAN